nr:tetratricopeptide repeat protein [Azospirillum brasilense]
MDLRDLLKATAGSAAELEPGHYRRCPTARFCCGSKTTSSCATSPPATCRARWRCWRRCGLFAPGEASLWRETGLLEAHNGNLAAAIAALETFLELTASERHRHQVAALIQQLKNQLN